MSEYGFSRVSKGLTMKAEVIEKEKELIKSKLEPLEFHRQFLTFLLECINKHDVTNPFLEASYYDDLEKNFLQLKELWSKFRRLDMSKKKEVEAEIGLSIFESYEDKK